MPTWMGMNFWKVRRQNPTVPVIAVTARIYDVDRENAQTAGFSDLVTKPFTDLATFFV